MGATEQPLDHQLIDGAVMAELFGSVGFKVADEESYNRLVESVETNGQRSSIQRGQAMLHGRCWKLGGGLEVWSILYDGGGDLYYADCRPAFRGRYIQPILPWELVEYDEDGEAIVRGCVYGGPEVVFELQNLTELGTNVFRHSHLHVTLAGLAYTARVEQPHGSRHDGGGGVVSRFEPAERIDGLAEGACENDYVIAGRILAWRDIRNPVSGSSLAWIYIDAASIKLEVLVNRRALGGQLRIGAAVTASIWLQGYVLEEADISARYEGVDQEYETGDFWIKLRREN